MTTTLNSESRIDSYLARTRVALRGLPESEIEDILRELRSHVSELAEQQGSDVDVALRSLGDPVDLAKIYRAESQVVQAECSGSPLAILQGLRHTTRTSLGRLTAGSLYALGYINVVTLWLTAIDKLFWPSRTGLWYVPGHLWSLKLVRSGNPAAGARELLGWWLVPAAFVTGWLLRYAVDHLAQAWVQRYRHSLQPRTPDMLCDRREGKTVT